MVKKTIKISLIITAVLCFFLGCFYIFINNTKQLPYANYTDFSTGSGYVYFKAIHNDSVIISVMTNSRCYMNTTDFKVGCENYNNFRYMFNLFLSNALNIPIRVNSKQFEACKWFIVEKELIEKFEKEDILNRRYIIGNLFNDSLYANPKDINALTYLLLRKQLRNCVQDCETGVTLLIPL